MRIINIILLLIIINLIIGKKSDINCELECLNNDCEFRLKGKLNEGEKFVCIKKIKGIISEYQGENKGDIIEDNTKNNTINITINCEKEICKYDHNKKIKYQLNGNSIYENKLWGRCCLYFKEENGKCSQIRIGRACGGIRTCGGGKCVVEKIVRDCIICA